MKKIKQLISLIRNPKIVKPFLGVITALAVLIAFVYIQKTKDRVVIENSIVSAPIVTVSSLNPGKLTEIDVYEGERVKKGDVLAVVGTDTLRADADGLVVMVNRQIGGTMTAANPIVQLINLADMQITGTLDENKGLSKIHPGQVISFTIDAFAGKTFWGYVDRVSQIAKQTQLSFSISSERPTQQFNVYANFDAGSYPEIKNGMSAKMTVYTKTP